LNSIKKLKAGLDIYRAIAAYQKSLDKDRQSGHRTGTNWKNCSSRYFQAEDFLVLEANLPSPAGFDNQLLHIASLLLEAGRKDASSESKEIIQPGDFIYPVS